MIFTPRADLLRRWQMVAMGAVASFVWSGCVARPSLPGSLQSPTAELSPRPEMVAPRDAWRLAEAYVIGHPDCEVMVGSGNSMLPLYQDRTVLVVQPVATSQLRRGMTVVFVGESGRPVAHVLTEKTPDGWRAMGLGNREADATRVRYGNLIGRVVKAYAPSGWTGRLSAAAYRPARSDAATGSPANASRSFALADAGGDRSRAQ